MLNNFLTNILHINENETDINKQQLIHRSSYHDLDQFSKLAKENKNSFSILSTNIQSINAKFSELEAFVEELNMINFKFSLICLQETWIDESEDISPFHLQGYDCISQGKTCTSKGGLIIYIDDQYKSKVICNLNTYQQWEGLVVKVQSNLSKTVTIGNIYRSPRTRNEDLSAFIDELTPIISSLEKNCNNDIVIAGDFNINLLKLNENEMVSSFFDMLISHSFYPQITLPTRFTRTTGTLIDNLFCRLHESIHTAGILTKRFSDHQPYFMIMHNTVKLQSPPKYVKINTLNENAMINVMNEIKLGNIYEKLNTNPNADPNYNYDIIYEEITHAKTKHMPNKLVKFNRYKHKKSAWITQGILTSIRYRDKMYTQLKLTNPTSGNYETIKINLKTYNTILKKNIRAAKQIYFESRFSLFRNDIRNTWKTINECLSKKHTNNSFPTYFEDNGYQMSNKQNIADAFTNYFTNIAQTIVNDIKYEGTKDFTYYLNRQINSTFKIQNVDEEAVNKIIHNLPTKHSCGFDGISSKLLQIIEPVILRSLTMVINQVQSTGIFPDKLKIAKVIPIFKKDDPTLLKKL